MAMRAPDVGDDIDRIMTVMATAFDPNYNEAWTRSQVSDILLIGNSHYQLIGADGTAAQDGQAVAGFALLRTICDEEELLLLAVAPELRRQGLGAKLLDRVKADARARNIKRILLEMRQGNGAAALYLRQDFARIGVRPKYYRDRSGVCIDALTFSCTLD